ncbi:MAG: aldo/keto reductase [Phycisphaerales bacterium]|nr:aldo/keto reductase [Planctomycetota bacterium]
MNAPSLVPRRPLGKSGKLVSVVGLGTVKLGRDSGVKYPVVIPDDEAAGALLDRAEQLGLNLLDTAPAYGRSEERLGQLLQGRRERWFVVTKAGEEWDGGCSTFAFGFRDVGASIERSRERLRTGHIDCVLLHSDGIAEQTPEGFEQGAQAILNAKRRGEVGLVGASVKTHQGARLAMSWADVLMLEFVEGDTQMEAIAAECARRGLGILAKKALGSGQLRGNGGAGAAVARVLGIEGVSSVIVGTTNPAHLAENCEAASRAVDELGAVSENGA